MGFSYQIAVEFFDHFLRRYLGSDDIYQLEEVKQKASLLGYSRTIRRLRKKKEMSEADRAVVD